MLSKDTNGQKVFQEFQRERKLRKIYKAVTRTSVPLGMHLHWMWAPQNARGKSGGPPCQLVSHTPPESRRKARVRKIIRFFGFSLLLLKLHTLSVELCSCSWYCLPTKISINNISTSILTNETEILDSVCFRSHQK